MKFLASLALQEFQALPLEKQCEILMQYVSYVEETLEAGEQPVFFLEWRLIQPGEESPDV